MTIRKIFRLSISLLLLAMITKNSYSAMPIDECQTFQDEELILMCMEFTIAERITDELLYDFNFDYINYNYSREYVDSLWFTGTMVSPRDPASDIRPGNIDGNGFYIYRAFLDMKLSDDDPETTFYELKILIEYGRAFVHLEKRTMN